MTELTEELRALAADLTAWEGDTMKRWDQIRKQVEELKGSDLPRLNFESLMDDISEKLAAAADALAAQQDGAWQPIETAPKDRFILLHCEEDDSMWLASWQGGHWYGVDVEHGLTREGHSAGDPNYVTGRATPREMSRDAPREMPSRRNSVLSALHRGASGWRSRLR